MPRHELTGEERAKGGHARAAAIRKRRTEAEALAAERLAALVEPALVRLAALLASDDESAATRAVREVLDRAIGRAVQRTEHSGAVELNVDARGRLADLVAHRATGKPKSKRSK